VIVSADPTVAFVDAFKAPLAADTVLSGALTGIFGHLSEAARTNYPYLVLGRRSNDGDAGAMGKAGHRIALQVDGWSDGKGPFEIEQIGSRVFALMERRTGFTVPGFTVIEQSLHREFAEIFDEPDEDSPDKKLYRTVQRWVCEIHES
jgi:hypothetical protein